MFFLQVFRLNNCQCYLIVQITMFYRPEEVWPCQVQLDLSSQPFTVDISGILYSTMTLFLTATFLIGASHANNWKMDKKFGAILLVWYFIVMAMASLYETNLLGDFNPEECHSDYWLMIAINLSLSQCLLFQLKAQGKVF